MNKQYKVISSSPDSCSERFTGTKEECEQWVKDNKYRFPGYVTLKIQPAEESAKWGRDFDIHSGGSVYEQMNKIDDSESLERGNVKTQRKTRQLIRESIPGSTEAIESARKYILDQYVWNDYDFDETDAEFSMTVWYGDEYGDEVETNFTMSIEKLVELKDDETAFKEYIDSCENSDDEDDDYDDYDEDEDDDAAEGEFYRRAEKELNKHFNCTGASLMRFKHVDPGRIFLFADNMRFRGNFNFLTGEDYIEKNDFEGFLELCKDSFTVRTDHEPLESSDKNSIPEGMTKNKFKESVDTDNNMKKLQNAATSVKCKLTPGFIEYATEDPEMLDAVIEDELLYCGKVLCAEFPEMTSWEFGEDEELTDNYGSYCVVETGTDKGRILVQVDGHGRIYNLE